MLYLVCGKSLQDLRSYSNSLDESQQWPQISLDQTCESILSLPHQQENRPMPRSEWRILTRKHVTARRRIKVLAQIIESCITNLTNCININSDANVNLNVPSVHIVYMESGRRSCPLTHAANTCMKYSANASNNQNSARKTNYTENAIKN